MNQGIIKFEEGLYKDTYCFQFTEGNKGKSCSIWYNTMREAEEHYIELINLGWKAEEARDILPLSLKTELYMCGFAEDWKKFFELRCAPNAHPQAKELAIPLKEEFIKRGYINE
jgi:thymidylate synthase (FAD)